jgi:uncharacterized protein (DUF427 family)
MSLRVLDTLFATLPRLRHEPTRKRIRAVLGGETIVAVHTAAGEPMSVRAAGQTRDGAAFRPADPELSGHVILDFAAFDAWHEEDERLVAHPRDPFHRLDILPSSREVRIELDGTLLAHSTGAHLLYEGNVLPVRFYLPPEDVRVPLLPSPTRTACAYKGEASYWTPDLARDAAGDLAWSYEAPLKEAAPLAGLVAFFNERVDVTVDGELQSRPHTPWA